MFEVLADYQGLIGAGFGSLGTWLGGAYLDHKQRASLRRSIISELRLIHRDLESHIEYVERATKLPGTQSPVFIQRRFSTETFDRDFGKLGLLPVEEIELIREAYMMVKECSEIFPVLSEEAGHESRRAVSAHQFERLITALRLPLKAIEKTLSALGRRVRAPKRSLPRGLIVVGDIPRIAEVPERGSTRSRRLQSRKPNPRSERAAKQL